MSEEDKNSAPEVLVIADDIKLLRHVHGKLSSWGFSPRVAQTSGKGLEEIAGKEPALALIDLEMPELDGIALLKEIRKKSPSLPVIFMAGYVAENWLKEAKKLGVKAFIPKSYEFNKALPVIQDSIEEGKNRKNKKQTVLIVEDEEELLEALRIRIESLDVRVITAGDGWEAWRKIRGESPDLILLDIMLPRISGFKVSRLIKFELKFRKIPVIMITARGEEKDQLLGKETGAEEYFVKPFDTKELMAKVKGYLGIADG